ncbi:BQ2448_2109 [Microbotryum intermedium]|uniref:BQ2448_2109 protein n=1 Tax=Microbotryum intermedium TaxID=269621 RepID=A0A238F8J9_9BASI|nr:BQ2448_2109 [Microbotryum intermedium]
MIHPRAPPVLSQTTLADRIARLNLVDGSTSSSSSDNGGTLISAGAGASSTSSSQLRTTGAVGRISDKISRFQANAEDAPLVPLGSFGLGGVRREPSSGISGAASDRRVASLGLGRAAVPLASVTPIRSVSSGGNGGGGPSSSTTPKIGRSNLSTRSSSPTATFSPTAPALTSATSTADASSQDSAGGDDAGSSAGTPTSSRASSQYGGLSAEFKSSSSGGSDMLANDRGLFARHDSSFSVASSETTTAGSESSLNVETGSLISELGPDPKSITIADSLTASVSSPLSSPVLSALVNPVEITVDEPEISSRSTTAGGSPRAFNKPLKGPLDALKTPSRSRSSVSVSSMLVETGSTASEDGDGQSTTSDGPLTPRAEEEEKPFPTTVGPADDDEETSGMATPNRSEQDEEAREQATQAELEKYEGEEFDAVAPRFAEEDEEKSLVEAPVPTAPDASTEADDSYGDMLDGYGSPTPDEPKSPISPMPGGMPMVKCSDCGTDVDLMELVDHTCAPSTSPSVSVAKTPSSKSFPAPPRVSAPPPGRNSGAMTPSASRDDVRRGTNDRYDSPSASPTRARTEPNAFVPQTESLVPDDILDAYDDEDDDIMDPHAARPAAAGTTRSWDADLPDDVGPDHDYEDLSSPVPLPPHPSAVQRDVSDLPEDVGEDHDALASSTATLSASSTTKTSKPDSLGRGDSDRRRESPKSVYDMVGGATYDSDDEYEGGSAQIVSVTHASHSPTIPREGGQSVNFANQDSLTSNYLSEHGCFVGQYNALHDWSPRGPRIDASLWLWLSLRKRFPPVSSVVRRVLRRPSTDPPPSRVPQPHSALTAILLEGNMNKSSSEVAPMTATPLPAEFAQFLFTHRNLLAAASASFVSTIAGFPLDSIKARIQVKRYSGVLDCARCTFAEEGVAGFFRGVYIPLLTITVVRTASFSIYSGVKDRLVKKRWVNEGSVKGIAASAFTGPFRSLGMFRLGSEEECL